MSLYEDPLRRCERYVASIPAAVKRYAASPSKPSEKAVAKYKAGLERYARILNRAASSLLASERQH